IVALAVGVAVVGSSALASEVPESGYLQWRSRSGLGTGIYGGISYNLFVGLQQDLVSRSSEPVFVARVSDSVDAGSVYWRLISLDVFDGQNWVPGDRRTYRPGEGDPWEGTDQAFRGPTVRAEQVVRIESLRQNYLPVAYSPVALFTDAELLDDSYRARDDGSIRFDALSYQGLTYRVLSDIPQPDVGALASRAGELSPIFRKAAEQGAFSAQPVPDQPTIFPDQVDHFLELPESLDPRLPDEAFRLTDGATTTFEAAVLLEAHFRDSGLFSYDPTVTTGHSTLDLAEWLLEPDSRNYHTGYCEQFATAMAVLARARGIPSRVALGFTPGEVGDDGLIVVRQRNAHAWVELWMVGQGWVRFDPTPRADGVNPATTAQVGFDPRAFLPGPEDLEQPEGADPAGLGADRNQPGEDFLIDTFGDLTALDGTTDQDRSWPAWMTVAIMVGVATGSVPAVKWVRRGRRLRRLQDGDLAAAWEEIVDRLRDLGHPIPAHHTPMEIAQHLDPSLVPLARGYSAQVYGPGRELGRQVVQSSRRSFQETEDRIKARYHPADRAACWFRPGSLRRIP
ncbi:MAG: transglutaminaseTgpA domain-containing protein, partial [Acidimicrobiia bacterium]